MRINRPPANMFGQKVTTQTQTQHSRGVLLKNRVHCQFRRMIIHASKCVCALLLLWNGPQLLKVADVSLMQPSCINQKASIVMHSSAEEQMDENFACVVFSTTHNKTVEAGIVRGSWLFKASNMLTQARLHYVQTLTELSNSPEIHITGAISYISMLTTSHHKGRGVAS